MKKLLPIFALLCSFASPARNEPLIDSLKTRLKNARTDSAKCYEMDVLAKEYMDIDPDSGFVYAGKALAYAQKIGKREYEVDALVTFGILHRERGEFDRSLDRLHQALEICNKYKLHSHYYERVYTCMNLSYTEQGNYTTGIQYGFKALQEIEKNGDTLAMALANNNLANTYFQIKQYRKALRHYNIALRYAIAIRQIYGQALLNGNMGSVYYEMEMLDSAKYFFERSLVMSKEAGDITGEANCYTNLGSYYQKKKEYTKAIAYFNQAEKIYREMKMQPNMADSYYNLATSYLEMKDYRQSEHYARQALDIADKIGSNPHKENAHLALKNVFEKLNNIPKAYYHFKEYIAARDSTFNENNRKEQFKAELVYEYDKKRYSDSLDHAMEAKLQSEELNREKERTQIQRRFTWSAVGACILLLVLVIYVFKSYHDKKKANLIISEQKDKVELQKREIEFQKTVLETRNKEVTDSINYAKRLQEAILPPERLVKTHLPDSFIFYKPKDIVAGDFYWLETVSGSRTQDIRQKNPDTHDPMPDTILIAAADCTGHGVPGAMVSVVCSNALNRTVNEFRITEPGKILDKTRALVIETFEHAEHTETLSGSEVKDGMDISLCSIDPKKNELQWAGANNPLWIIRKGELMEFKPNKQPIGKTDNPVPFTTHTIALEKGDVLYLFSDGFADQFGGDKGKKFKLSSLKELFQGCYLLPMKEQLVRVNDTLDQWQGNIEQVDDILVIGIRI